MHRLCTTTTPAIALPQVSLQTTAPPDIPNVSGKDTTYAVKPEDAGEDADDDKEEDMSVDGDEDETVMFYTVGDDGKGTSTIEEPLPPAHGHILKK